MELLDNGFDSLRKCVTGLKQVVAISETSSEYEYLLKDITINLHHSTETLFKYLVMKYNPNLIYADVNKHFKQETEKLWSNPKISASENTIQFLDAIHCVIVAYSLSMKKETYKKIKKLNDIRNDLTHYTFTFSPKEMENRIALLLPDLFEIYVQCIPEFESYAKANRLYSDTESLTRKAEIWSLKQSLLLKHKWICAQNICTVLSEHPERIQVIFQKKKDAEKYTTCACCGENLFYVTSNHIASATDVRLLGICEYCGFQIDDDDGKLFSSFLESDEQISEDSLNNIIGSNLENAVFITQDSLQEEIRNIFTDYRAEIESSIGVSAFSEVIKNSYLNLLDDICEYLSAAYFEDNIYPNNDSVEEADINEELDIDLDYWELRKYQVINEFNEEIFQRFVTVSNRIKALNEELFNTMLSYCINNYHSYHNGMYINSEGEDVDIEFTINVRVSAGDTDHLLELLEDAGEE